MEKTIRVITFKKSKDNNKNLSRFKRQMNKLKLMTPMMI